MGKRDNNYTEVRDAAKKIIFNENKIKSRTHNVPLVFLRKTRPVSDQCPLLLIGKKKFYFVCTVNRISLIGHEKKT